MPQGGPASGGDDLASTDEVKVYKDEGEEDENRASENLSEDKFGLVTETEEGKTCDGEDQRFRQLRKSSAEAFGFRSAADYSLPGHFPFGYPLITPYSYPYGSALGLGGLGISPAGLTFCMYNSEVFAHPPPAHMGLPPTWPLHPHIGLPSQRPTVYGMTPPHSHSSAGPSFYGIHSSSNTSPPPPPPFYGFSSPYRQFSHPFYPAEFSSVGWSGPAMSLASPYMTYQLSQFNRCGSLSPPPQGSLPGYPTGISRYPGISHPALVKTSQQQETAVADGLRNQHRNLLPHHSTESYSGSSGYQDCSKSSSSKSVHMGSSRKAPHIKKPLNAFMIFMKEMRQRVIDECTLKESAAINQILGQKWHSLDRSEQAKFYELARREKERHRQLYPMWSARDNYALRSHKKRKRNRLFDDNKMAEAEDDRECPNAKKCRARFGLDKQNKWCKPCRRKKRCIRFLRDSERNRVEEDLEEEDEDEEDGSAPHLRLVADSTTEVSSPMPSSFSSGLRAPVEETRHSSVSSFGTSGSAMSCDDGTPAQQLTESLRSLHLMSGQRNAFDFPVPVPPATSVSSTNI